MKVIHRMLDSSTRVLWSIIPKPNRSSIVHLPTTEVSNFSALLNTTPIGWVVRCSMLLLSCLTAHDCFSSGVHRFVRCWFERLFLLPRESRRTTRHIPEDLFSCRSIVQSKRTRLSARWHRHRRAFRAMLIRERSWSIHGQHSAKHDWHVWVATLSPPSSSTISVRQNDHRCPTSRFRLGSVTKLHDDRFVVAFTSSAYVTTNREREMRFADRLV